jgi:hypothetical protein
VSDPFKRKIIKNQAERIALEAGFASIPVSPFAIAGKHGIATQEMPASAGGVSGMLVRLGNDFGIMYAGHVESEGFKRFSVGHELGHYFLEGHPEAVLKSGAHTSHAGHVSRDKYEIEADQFAAALLMPEDAFKKAISELTTAGLNAVTDLHDRAMTSLTSTAFRYAELGDEAIAVLLCEGTKVLACGYSDRFKSLGKLGWLVGKDVPASTMTRGLSTSAVCVARGDRREDEIDLSSWFDVDQPHVRGLEQVCGLGGYGRTLTIISSKVRIEDDLDFDENEDEQQLIESWTPRFRR